MKNQMIHLVLFTLYLFGMVANLQAEEEGEAVAPKSQYVELKPSFVANFGSGSSKLSYIKADISLRVPSAAAATAIEAHQPLVRHHIVMLLSSQSEQEMAAPTSQETVRQEALAVVQKALEEETGASQVDDLLFTSFVVQR